MQKPLFVGLALTLALGSWTRSAAASAEAGTVAVTSREAPSPSVPALMEAWGRMIAAQEGLTGITLDDEELGDFQRGFERRLQGLPAEHDLSLIFPDVERLARQRRAPLVRAVERRNEAAAAEALANLRKNPAFSAGAADTWVERLDAGQGTAPKPGQTVTLHYVGRLADGTEFAQYGPLEFVLVPARSVCRGWIEAIQRLQPGGRLRLHVPPPLPETEAGKWGVEPGSLLSFEIELLAVRETSAEELANSLVETPAEEVATPAPSGFTERQVIAMWGWTLAQKAKVPRYELSAEEGAALARGLGRGIRSLPSAAAAEGPAPADVERYLAQRREGIERIARQKRDAQTAGFFAQLKPRPEVIELPSGLYYELVTAGRGAVPKVGQTVRVDYTGTLLDGTIFDRTDNEPLYVEVGSVIPGWNEGIQKIGAGGRIKLYIPPQLGYGERATSGHLGPIPPGSVLIYDITLLEILDAPPGG
jgi:FKBP-type peptidyl-prolyl cis-trans isomerase